MSYVYLACPYSHRDARIRKSRYNAALVAAAELMSAGMVVFCPIAHSHNIAAHLPRGLLLDHDFWMQQDLPLLAHAEKMLILGIPGWDESSGVLAERRYADDHGIPVEMMWP